MREYGNELAIGTAGEHLVCADLLSRGVTAFRSDQSCSFDVAALIDGRLLRIQVKTTEKPRRVPARKDSILAYMWFVKRCGKNGSKDYSTGAFDLLALVALDSKQIAYMLPSQPTRTVHIRKEPLQVPRKRPGKTFEMFTFEKSVEALCTTCS